MKKQSEWMRGLLAAERMVLYESDYYTVLELISHYDFKSNHVFHGSDYESGIKDYLDNYKERKNAEV